MKKLLFLLLIGTVIYSCKCKKNTIEKAKETLTDCPVNAKCTKEVHKDSALFVEKDAMGKPLFSIVSKRGSTVYHYQMTEKQDEQYMDAGYREEIIFELPSNLKNETISGKQIATTKAIFGVFCYCKGKAGYYVIQDGTITKLDNTITIEIPAIVEEQKVRIVKF